MKHSTIMTTALLLFFFPNIKAQTVAPLQLGNIWVYDLVWGMNNRIAVIDTNIVIDSVSYFKLGINYDTLDNKYVRLTEDGYYARYDVDYPNNLHLYYKKDAVKGDTWTNGEWVYSIEDTFTASVFGETTTVKYLTIWNGHVGESEYWTEKFGLWRRGLIPELSDTLQGCVIDGVVYGDTSLTPVRVKDELIILGGFWLKQNYPNPFNPSTIIQYATGSRQFVTIKVYDVLGNEVAILVNEEKLAGEYEVEFDAGKYNLSSGTYIYSLEVNNVLLSKKLTYIK